MLTKVKLPKAFSVRDEHEFYPMQHLMARLNPELMVMVERQIPLGRTGTPEEAAGAVYLLCTPESDYISGQTLEVNGGWRG